MMLKPNSLINEDSKVVSKLDYKIKSKDRLYAGLFIGPSLLLLLIFVIYPMFRTLYLSFFLTDSLGRPTVFNGLGNYVTLFTSQSYISSLLATLVYVFAVSILTLVVGLLLATIANQKLRGIEFFRTIYTSTMGVSVSVAAIFWLFIFNPSVGLLDQIGQWLNLGSPNWLATPQLAMAAVVISSVWMNLGFTFLIIFGALQSVPNSLYDAADIAGTTKTYQFFKITIPMISPTLFFVVIITLIESFKSFGLIDLMKAGGPNDATNLLVYRIYQDSFLNGNYGLASSESVVLAVIIAIFTVIQFKFLGKKVTY